MPKVPTHPTSASPSSLVVPERPSGGWGNYDELLNNLARDLPAAFAPGSLFGFTPTRVSYGVAVTGSTTITASGSGDWNTAVYGSGTLITFNQARQFPFTVICCTVNINGVPGAAYAAANVANSAQAVLYTYNSSGSIVSGYYVAFAAF